MLTIKELRQRLARFPRRRLIHLPTPFAKLEDLGAKLGGPELYIKRDDLTGMAFGGNKSRKLEFIIADALNKGADTLITWASLQSNWCLQTAVAARRYGLRCILVLFRTYDLPPEYDGNLLLDYLAGADIRIQEAARGKVVSLDQASIIMDEIAEEERKQGHIPYVVSVGGSMTGFSMDYPLGAISYVAALAELIEQVEAENIVLTHILHATGSGATQAGLVVGEAALKRGIKVVGISVSDRAEVFRPVVLEIARQTEKAIGLDSITRDEDILVVDDYLEAGYGVLTPGVAEAIRVALAQEGIVLDPVYTGKAMAALLNLIRKGNFAKNDRIVFFHTGGTPALFPYRKQLMELLK
ncbi:MAG: D-cysteine desulfhydrase family protein [Candidatus Aminicenantales bacterium]